jgi:hypothetical protein
MIIDTPYLTMDAAGLAAEAACEPISWHSGYEFGGLILEKDGKFYYTPAQTSKIKNHTDLRVSFTSDYHFVAIYHTHPGHAETDRWFSDVDTRAATVHRVASYIGIEYEHGAVRKFIPGVTHVQHSLEGDIALGEIVK